LLSIPTKVDHGFADKCKTYERSDSMKVDNLQIIVTNNAGKKN